MSVRKDGKIIAGTTVNPDLFDFKWADHILDDISWVRADTFSWQNGSFYTALYNHLANDIQGKTSADLITETIGGVTIAYYLAADGHKIVEPDQEVAVVSIYNTVGVAWYYIVDVENARFKLPRTKFGFTGMRNGVGKYVAPGAPNITAVFGTDGQYSKASGAVSVTTNGRNAHGWNGSGQTQFDFTFDASRSSSIYGNSTTVQPPATQMYLYFYAGNYTPSAVAQTAGLNTELFNNKVDKGHQVIEFQAPTATNNYTWYRKYADGWVEQGGSASQGTVNLPVPMTNTGYSVVTQSMGSGSNPGTHVQDRTTTSFVMGNSSGWSMVWTVFGYAAS